MIIYVTTWMIKMSRTYRKSSLTEEFKSVESYINGRGLHHSLFKYNESNMDYYTSYYKEINRDGKSSNGPAKKGYRHESNVIIRRSNKKNIEKTLRGEDVFFKTQKDGKYLVWCYW